MNQKEDQSSALQVDVLDLRRVVPFGHEHA